MIKLRKFGENPIIQPIPQHPWESQATFNPAAVYEGGKVHIIYRAMSEDNTSVLGYASSKDGVHIDERLPEPIYVPREDFEKKAAPGNSGCEDPRITKIGDRFYMCYTAFDAKNPTRVALTSIKVEDFLRKQWNWKKPILISPPGIDDKNACILPEKVDGKYVIFHRIHPCIWIDLVDSLEFIGDSWIKGSTWFKIRTDKWDNRKIGIAAPPIKTEDGWLLIYHGLSEQDQKYRLGAMLLELKNPTQAIFRSDYPILEPEERYENEGLRPKTVFACGAVVIKDELFVYYGAADKYVCVATANLNEFLGELKIKPLFA
jgi:predicted GH43/DUF377 family glycosyl hydrolase